MNQNYQEMDMRKKPQTHVTPLYCVAEGLSFVLAAFYNHKLIKSDEVKKLKGPYIVLANHASFTDFVDQFKSFHNRKMCWVVSIEEFYNNELTKMNKKVLAIYTLFMNNDMKELSLDNEYMDINYVNLITQKQWVYFFWEKGYIE